jgi:hypothetical protein
MILGALSGQVVSESAINNNGLIVGRAALPVTWKYDVANSSSTPVIQQLPIPSGFFAAQPAAVNDSGDLICRLPNIDAHAILCATARRSIWASNPLVHTVSRRISNLGR